MGTSRAGARRAAKPKRSVRPQVVGLGVGAFLALVAWAALVWVAIHFGRSARGGDSGKWAFLAAASVGAVLCLFLCLWLVTVLLRRIGIMEDNRQPAHPHRDERPPAHPHRDERPPAHPHRDERPPAHPHKH
jgi:ABC-type nickel/cobalt efflux system permease component RcnA